MEADSHEMRAEKKPLRARAASNGAVTGAFGLWEKAPITSGGKNGFFNVAKLRKPFLIFDASRREGVRQGRCHRSREPISQAGQSCLIVMLPTACEEHFEKPETDNTRNS